MHCTRVCILILRCVCTQFGLPPSRVETVKLDAYSARIPVVLVQMKDYLLKNGGLEIEGIFRLAPDADESQFVKRQLDANRFDKCQDVNCISNLIKVRCARALLLDVCSLCADFRTPCTRWCRSGSASCRTSCSTTSSPRLSRLSKRFAFFRSRFVWCARTAHPCVCDLIASSACFEQEADAGAIINTVPEPYQSILLWLLDLCLTVANYSHINKMTPQNLAIVIGSLLLVSELHVWCLCLTLCCDCDCAVV